MNVRPVFDQTNALTYLKRYRQQMVDADFSLKRAFAGNPARAGEHSVRTPHFYFDYSRQLVDAKVMQALFELADERGLKDSINAMMGGERINLTENSADGSPGRGVLHTALRHQGDTPVLFDGQDVMPNVRDVLGKIKDLSERVLSGQLKGVTGKPIKNIVSIGIGGSYLGPEYLAVALKPYAQKDMNLVFIANVDCADFAQKTAGLDPAETLVIVVSKTFTTPETMQNARTARAWIKEKLANHAEAVKRHFVAVSTAKEEVADFGIDPKSNMFEFWDWVGGRYSATSAVGALSLSLYLGYPNFHEVLRGANWLDIHFQTAPWAQNLPVLSALVDIYNINVLGLHSRALLPYAQGLAKLPAHTQQVEMESNGKRVLMDGTPVHFSTGEVVFGEPGTNGQHSFYQEIHHGQVIPADFIGFLEPQYAPEPAPGNEVSHHDALTENFLAQPDALAFGHEDRNQHKLFPGNRPSSSLLLQSLNPFTAGLLLAWTEHRAAVKGFIWGINSFDQFGVELGKVLGKDHRRRIEEFHKTGKMAKVGLSESTATILGAFLHRKLP